MPELDIGGRRFLIDRARKDDVPALVALIRNDTIAAGRELAELRPYREAFERVDADPAQFLVAVRDGADEIVGTMQLTFIPGLSRGGILRLQIEAVRVAEAARGMGLGTAMLQWAIDYGKTQGARLVQLTTDTQRVGAHQLYERLGFVPSHVGMKLTLE